MHKLDMNTSKVYDIRFFCSRGSIDKVLQGKTSIIKIIFASLVKYLFTEQLEMNK